MGSRIREKPACFFEFFMEITKNEGEAPSAVQQFPMDYNDKGILTEIPKFAFPCETDGSQVDHFSFVVPDIKGMFRFGFCRHSAGHQTCLVIVSLLPWFDVFFKLLDHLSVMTSKLNQDLVLEFLQEAHDLDIPAAKMPVSIVAGQEMFNFTTPDPSALPSIPGNRNLTEYYNALDTHNMMLVFASMLQERRIIMTSKKLSRLTSCIFAADSLLYPMCWQHTFIPVLPGHIIECIGLMAPYIIGVHGNLIPRLEALQEDLSNVVCVDLDNNAVSTEHNDLGCLPGSVVSALKKDLKTDKVKSSVQKDGDAISQAFLKALVRLIGGYSEALKSNPGEPVTFDEKAFVASRSSSSYQAFLQGMLSLQAFNEFIHGKIYLMNAGVKCRDEFEQQAEIYAQRHSKRSTRANLKGMKVKFKAQGKRALSSVISGLTDSEDKKGDNAKTSSKSAKQSTMEGTAQKLATTLSPWSDHSKTDSLIRPQSVPSKQDSVDASLSYTEMSMDLLGDSDIQAVLRSSPSAEILNRKDSFGSSSSVSSSDETGSVRSNLTGSLSSLNIESASLETFEKKPTLVTSTGDKLIRPASKAKNAKNTTSLNAFLITQLGKSHQQHLPATQTKTSSAAKTPTSAPSDPLTSASKGVQGQINLFDTMGNAVAGVREKGNCSNGGNDGKSTSQLDVPLITFDSAESDVFDPLATIGEDMMSPGKGEKENSQPGPASTAVAGGGGHGGGEGVDRGDDLNALIDLVGKLSGATTATGVSAGSGSKAGWSVTYNDADAVSSPAFAGSAGGSCSSPPSGAADNNKTNGNIGGSAGFGGPSGQSSSTTGYSNLLRFWEQGSQQTLQTRAPSFQSNLTVPHPSQDLLSLLTPRGPRHPPLSSEPRQQTGIPLNLNVPIGPQPSSPQFVNPNYQGATNRPSCFNFQQQQKELLAPGTSASSVSAANPRFPQLLLPTPSSTGPAPTTRSLSAGSSLGLKSGSTSSFLASRGGNGGTTNNDSRDSAKKQADLLSDLIGVSFGEGAAQSANQKQQQTLLQKQQQRASPQQFGSVLRPTQPK